MGASVPSKRVLLIFASGITLGFFTTYFFRDSHLQYQNEKKANVMIPNGFIPDSPHSHGEMDSFAGPDQEQKWHDFEDHHQGKLLLLIADQFSTSFGLTRVLLLKIVFSVNTENYQGIFRLSYFDLCVGGGAICK